MSCVLIHYICCGVLPPQKNEVVAGQSGTPTWRNIPSISADTANWSWRKLSSTWIKFWSKSGPVSKDLFKEKPWNFAASFSTLRTFLGLFRLITGWCGRYHSLSDRCSIMWASGTVITLPFCRSSSMVFAVHRCCVSRELLLERFKLRAPVTKSSYSGAGCCHQPKTYRHRTFGLYDTSLFLVFYAREHRQRIVGQPACTMT